MKKLNGFNPNSLIADPFQFIFVDQSDQLLQILKRSSFEQSLQPKWL